LRTLQFLEMYQLHLNFSGKICFTLHLNYLYICFKLLDIHRDFSIGHGTMPQRSSISGVANIIIIAITVIFAGLSCIALSYIKSYNNEKTEKTIV
jgi:hypothetical protein